MFISHPTKEDPIITYNIQKMFLKKKELFYIPPMKNIDDGKEKGARSSVKMQSI